MATPVPPYSRSALKDLHKQIDFFDRKMSYCQNYEKFDSEKARATALLKLVTNREALVKTALGMESRGIVCDPKYLPRSFRAQAASGEVPNE